ncbi:MAG: virulence factor MviN, partial [Pseudomonadota bacterium]|nr:virulence factor MviN [Pseudomonadota bacterium]
MGGALLSKVLGLVREILIARAIGASLVADSFRGGLTAVFLPLAILQGETVPAILIPVYREWDRMGEAPRRFGALTLALTLLAALMFGIVELTAPLWIDVLLGGFSVPARDLTLSFTRIMALAMPASVLLCCLSASEIARGRSRITSIRATLVNVAVIGGVLLLLATGQAIALAWSFTLAFNAVAVWAVGAAITEGAVSFSGIGAAEILSTFVLYMRRLRPLLLQPLAEQGEIWIERLLASALTVGTIASLDYARTLSDSATLLIGQPLGLAVLSAGPGQDQRTQMETLARPVLAIAIPGSFFLVCFAPEVVELV